MIIFVLVMKIFVFGNSLLRSVDLDGYATKIINPGATIEDLREAALQRNDVRDCLVYLIEGPIRYSKIIKTQGRGNG